MLSADHPDASGTETLSISGEPIATGFVRVAVPVPGVRTSLTLVVQIEPDGSGSAFPFTPEHPLVNAMPAIASAYSHCVGKLEQHREDLLAKLQSAQTSTALLLVEGMTERQIAERHGRSQNTVHDHVKRIYAAWGVRSRVALRDLWCGSISP